MPKHDEKKSLLRSIPKVDEFLNWVENHTLAAGDSNERGKGKGRTLFRVPPQALIKKSIRQVLAAKREAILNDSLTDSDLLSKDILMADFETYLQENMRLNFRTVINATGVVIHTNMGRSLLPRAAMTGLADVGSQYSNLEFDLKTGKRGSRYSLVEELICELTGAEAALVVNNNAAAVLLVLGTIAADKQVIVSRGQLVEIGGSFRIPDVMAKSGARLVEVGATNRTHLRDYEQAVTHETGLLLKVHTSNYRMIGFTSEVPLADLVALGQRHGLPVMEDLGSGCLVDLSPFGLAKEPTVKEVVADGVDVVTFSGDKLLGGPQAGLILGKKDIIDQVKKNPLNRALRIDKFTLAGLEAVLRMYYDEHEALQKIPTLAMISASFSDIDKKAKRLSRLIKKRLAEHCLVSLVTTESRVGGGALPEQGLQSRAVALRPVHTSVNVLEQGLRNLELPIIGRIENEDYLLDMRTVDDCEVRLLADGLLAFWGVS